MHSTVAFLSAFLTAVFALQWKPASFGFTSLWIALGCAIAIAGATIVVRRTVGISLLAAVLGACIATCSVWRFETTPKPIAAYATNVKATIEGAIDRPPDDRVSRIEYGVAVKRMRIGTGAWMAIEDDVLAIDRIMGVRASPGDIVRIAGTLKLAEDSEDFAYGTYLALENLHAIIEAKYIDILACTETHRIARMLFIGRMRFEDHIAAVFPEPAAALLAGLLTGSRRGLPESVTDDFRTTGLSHIVAVSGSNITVVLSVIGGMLFFLPLRWRFLPCAAGVCAFALFTGASASVVRAAIMGVIGLLAVQTGNMPHMRLAILWTAFFMLVVDPARMAVDAGFQLSFLAVIGMVECSVLVEPLVRRLPNALGIREALTATLCAQATTTPWIAAKFGSLSLVAPIANLVAAPLIAPAMFIGAAGTLTGLLHPTIGRIVGLPAQFLLELIVDLAHVMSSLPFAAIEVGKLSNVFLVVCYGALIAILLRMKKAARGAASSTTK